MRARMLACGAIAGMAALAPLAAAAPAHRQGGAARSGVVVDWGAAAHTATVALPGGRLLAIHVRRAVRPGARVRLAGLSALPDGSFRARLRVIGRVRTALVRGTVVAHLGPRAVAIGAPGVTFAVHLGSGGRAAGATGPKLSMELGGGAPPVGAQVSADVSIGAGGTLSAPDMTQTAPPSAGQTLRVEGQVSAIDPTAGTLTLTLGDDGLSADITIAVPAGVDVSGLAVGDEAELSITRNADGSFTLAALDDQEGDQQDGDQQDGSAGQSGADEIDLENADGTFTLATADDGNQGQADAGAQCDGRHGDQQDD